ncbi:MAG: hypothetical protein ABI053_04910 [Lacisediminihabitans sp.]
MAEFDTDFVGYAELVNFPRSQGDLTNTTICPACLSPLTNSVCQTCFLDLNHPAAAELFQLSADAAAALDRRTALIGRIRFETAQLLQQQAATRAATLARAAPADTVAPPVAVETPAKPGLGSDPFMSLTATPGGVDASAGPSPIPSQSAIPRRSSVQVILLVVGVSLLSIAAIFFLVFAFITYGLIARSIIIGSITLAALVAASLLKRRGLRATAEGIAVFAVVLVYLDAFAVRANNLAGSENANAAVYWGIALSGSAIAFMLWHRASTLRAPNFAAFIAFVPGIGLLVGGLTEPLLNSTQYFAAFVAAAVAGLIHVFRATRISRAGVVPTAVPERVIALTVAGISLVCAFFTAFAVQPDSVWAPTLALVIVAVVALIHVLLMRRADAPPSIRALVSVIAGVGAVAFAALGIAIALRPGTNFANVVQPALFWPAVVGATAALALEAVARRTTNPVRTLPARVAAFSATMVAALVLTVPLFVALFTTLTAAGAGYFAPWGSPANATAEDVGLHPTVAIAALATVTLLVAVFWAASGLLRKRSAILVWPSAAVVVLAVPLIGIAWMITAGWLFLAAAGVVLLGYTRDRLRFRGVFRLPIAVGSVTALALGYSASWASIDTWGWASLACVAIMLAARSAVKSIEAARPQRVLRAMLLGGAVVVALVGAAALARQLDYTTTTTWASGIDALRFTGILATLLIAAAAVVPARTVSPIDRRVGYWIATPVALLVTLTSAGSIGTAGASTLDELLLPEFGTSLILGLALLGALALWVVPSVNSALRPERIVASIAIAPTIYWVVDSFTRVLTLPEYARMTAPIVASLLVAVGALVATLPRPSTAHPSTPSAHTAHQTSLPRWIREVSIVLVAVPAILFVVTTDHDAGWLVLLLAGVTALILATSADGLFASVSTRKHFGWLAIVLVTAGLWWRLAGEQVSALELYVLPLAAILLLVAFMMWRASNRSTGTIRDDGVHTPARSAAPFVALGGLLVAILPLAVDATTSDPIRAFVIGAVSALLLLGGVFIMAGGTLGPYLDAAAVAGAIGVLITGAGRGVFLVWEPGGLGDARLDVWLGATFLVLVLAAVGIPWANDTSDKSRSRRKSAAQTLVVLAMVAVLVLENASLGSDERGAVRAFTVTVLFAILYLVGAAWSRMPFTPLVGWIGLGFAAATALNGVTVSALDPAEFGAIPIAAALIIGGALHLARNPGARSWPHLGPGLMVLLLPSLIASTIAPVGDRPLWRLVGLGVLSITVLIVGVVRRLQAPFILGVIVTLIHGIATFSTEIRIAYEAIPGYYWLAAGGVLLIVLAARYEKRIKNLKDAAIMVTSLR